MALNKKKVGAVIGTAAAAVLVASVAKWEGKRNSPYLDIINVQTVCYGETKVKMRYYTDAECRDMLERSLTDYAEGVLKRNPELATKPYQLAAATSLTYNIGIGAYNRSTVAKRFSQRRWREACDAFLMWSKAGGKTVNGLFRRRQDERAICLTGI